MSLEEKIKSAKPSSWLTEGIPKWKVWLIVRWERIKLALMKAKMKNV